jgi:hypothetical protein
MVDWLTNHRILLVWLGAASVLAFLATLFIVPWLVVRIPPDYFTHRKRHHQARHSRHPMIQVTLVIAKNVLGCLFVLIGFLMLFLPGQGIMTMLIGVMFLDFPGKYHLERRLVSYGPVFRSINWLRHQTKRDPLNRPSNWVD